MKKQMILMVALCIAMCTACGQKSEVPAKVQSAFEQKVPDAKEVEWEFDKEDNLWEAEYEVGKTEYTVAFTENGEWMETENEIKFEDLPEAVKETIKLKYTDYEVEEVEFVENPEGSFYEIEVELEKDKQEIEIELLLNIDGKVVKEENEQEEEKGNDDE